MAFPASSSAAATTIGTAGTPHTVNLPASLVAGDLVLVLGRSNVGTAFTMPSGFTKLKDVSQTGTSADRILVAYKYLQSGDAEIGASTMSITPGGSSKASYLVLRITGAENPATQAPEISADATGASATPDPGAVTPTGGAKDYLFIWLGAWEGEQTSPPASNPTNYTLFKSGSGSGTGGQVDTNTRCALAGRQLNTGSAENPGSWTISASDDWIAWTVVIHPPGAGTAHEVNPADSVTMSDALALEQGKVIADTLSLADALALERGLVIGDSVGLADAVFFDRELVVGDSLTLSDAQEANLGREVTPADSVTMSDNAATETGKGVTVDDVLALADAVKFDRELVVADSVPLADAIAFAFDLHPTDAVAVADQIDTEHGIFVVVVDSVTVSDLITPELNPGGEPPAAGRLLVWFRGKPGGTSGGFYHRE